MGVFLGTIGVFFVLCLLYARAFPVLALNEVKTILRATGEFGVKSNQPVLATGAHNDLSDTADGDSEEEDHKDKNE